MSHGSIICTNVESKKWPSRPVDFRGRGPYCLMGCWHSDKNTIHKGPTLLQIDYMIAIEDKCNTGVFDVVELVDVHNINIERATSIYSGTNCKLFTHNGVKEVKYPKLI